MANQQGGQSGQTQKPQEGGGSGSQDKPGNKPGSGSESDRKDSQR